MHANHPVPPDALVEELWEGRPPASAEATLRNHLSALRRQLAPDRVRHVPGGYRLTVAGDELDADFFQADLAEDRDRLMRGDAPGPVLALEAASGRWRGRALAEVADADWARPMAARLEDLRLVAIELSLEARLATGEHHEVVGAARSAVAEHPLREPLWSKLMLALYRCDATACPPSPAERRAPWPRRGRAGAADPGPSWPPVGRL